MIGSFLTRIITMLLGYIYPAYECFKTVEQRRPNVEILRFWCQYWIIIAIVTVVERFGDALISWVPMYSEAKLAFIVYLWYPKTKGTSYVYYTFLRPYVTSHESEIDQHLNDLRARALDFVVHYWQTGAGLAQAKFFEILQFLASQNRPQPQAPPQVQPPQQPALAPQGFGAQASQGPVPQVPRAPQGPAPPPPPPPAAFYPPPPPPGYEASAPTAPPMVAPPGPGFPLPQGVPQDPNYRPGYYPAFPAPAGPSQVRGVTLREEIDLDEIDEEYVMPGAPDGGTTATSSSRYMTRSRHRATATTSSGNGRGW